MKDMFKEMKDRKDKEKKRLTETKENHMLEPIEQKETDASQSTTTVNMSTKQGMEASQSTMQKNVESNLSTTQEEETGVSTEVNLSTVQPTMQPEVESNLSTTQEKVKGESPKSPKQPQQPQEVSLSQETGVNLSTVS